jgi:hypothetical protein
MGRGIRLRNTAHVYQSDFYPLTSLRSTRSRPAARVTQPNAVAA